MCDSPDFYREEIVRARKCCECRREIAVGDRYQRASGKWDGEVETFTTCEPCVALRAALAKTVDDVECGVLLGMLFESIDDAERWNGAPLFARDAAGVPVAPLSEAT